MVLLTRRVVGVGCVVDYVWLVEVLVDRYVFALDSDGRDIHLACGRGLDRGLRTSPPLYHRC
jgi:hypothetical protein